MHRADVQHAAREAMRQSRSFVGAQIETRTELFGRQLTAVGSELQRIASDMRSNPTVPGGADLAMRGADLATRAGAYFEHADSDRMMADAERFTRQRPLVAAAIAAASGFALSRLLKAAASRRYAAGTPATDGATDHGR
jgi:hypothetical protein